MQLLGDALDVVEAVNANDELHARKSLFQLSNTRLDRVFPKVLLMHAQRGMQHDAWKRTSMKELGSIPMGNVPTCAKRPSNSTPFGIVGKPRIRVHEDKK